jgi:hypothetical protein
MEVAFLTPLGGLVALTALVPLGALVLRERRARRIRTALGLAQPAAPRALVPLVAALAAVGALLGLAATQPVVETERNALERTDAEAFVVVDVSRSMLAAPADGAARRIDRAREEAQRLRDALPEVPVGVLSLTDRVLPHLFPTVDGAVFRSTVAQAVDVERPPPSLFFSTRATDLAELGTVPARGFFSPGAKKRLLIVLTDGESQPVDASLESQFGRQPRIETVYVHVWRRGEQIFVGGVPERAYTADPASGSIVQRVAQLTGGRAFAEGDPAAVTAATAALGRGSTRERVLDGERRALMPYAAALVLLPLAFLIRRRNL